MLVTVRDNNIDQALRVLKKKMQREGVFREMKNRRAYEKPSEKKKRIKLENITRSFKTSFLSALFLIIGYFYFFKALSYENHTSLVVLIAYIIFCLMQKHN